MQETVSESFLVPAAGRDSYLWLAFPIPIERINLGDPYAESWSPSSIVQQGDQVQSEKQSRSIEDPYKIREKLVQIGLIDELAHAKAVRLIENAMVAHGTLIVPEIRLGKPIDGEAKLFIVLKGEVICVDALPHGDSPKLAPYDGLVSSEPVKGAADNSPLTPKPSM
jgi:hypothetical protein